MRNIPFVFRAQVIFPLQYNDEVRIPFAYKDKITVPMVLHNLREKIDLTNISEIEMVLIHDKLSFGMDRFTLGQLTTLTLGTLDPFPLDVG